MPSAKDIKMGSDNLKVMVIGDTGSGKSRFASTAPTPGFLFDIGGEVLSYRGKDWDYETFDISSKGAGKLSFILNQVISNTYDPEDPKNEARRKPGEGKKYKTYVLDNTTALSQLAMAQCMELNSERDEAGGPLFNIHYSMAAGLVMRTLRQFMSLGSAIRIVCTHTDLIKDKKGNVIRAKPLLGGKLPTVIPGYFDEVLYSRTKQIEGKVHYGLQTRNFGLYPARSRLSGELGLLPDTIPNDFSALTNGGSNE